MLDKKELNRYSRHIILSEIGIAGQEKLKKAKALVIGAGGLGCPALQYLTAAGVGTIGIIDNDVVDETNLHRQILFNSNEIGMPKAEIAAQKLKTQNPYVNFDVYIEKLTSSNALHILSKYDIIVDGSDNFPTRYLVNDACVITAKPFVYGSVYKFEGQVSVFNFKGGPTYRCLFPEPPGADASPNCAETGVLGILPGIIGCLQANEAIKIIAGIGEPLSGKLFVYDSLSQKSDLFEFEKNPKNSEIRDLVDYEDFCGVKTEKELNSIREISVRELKAKIERKENIQIVDVREPFEYEICNLNGELIPLGEIEKHIEKIHADKPVIIYCHHGRRSALAISRLQEKHGFKNLYGLKGGIHEWAIAVDNTMNVY